MARPWLAIGWRRSAIVAVVLAGAFALGAEPLIRPDPRSLDAPPDTFSAERAMAQVRVIARGPHPAGSPAMAGVSGYLVSQLGSAGLDSRRQVVEDSRTGITLRNTIGTVPGSDPSGAVLLVSHPDSVPHGPGAADNATGAAVLLEVARALAHGPPPRNDIVFLFDDGEELGFRGGHEFARRDPLMRDVELVVGVDTAAWGTPYVVQTADENGTLVRGYASGVDEPVAYGMASSVNDGDFETAPFRDRGLPAIELEDTYADNSQHTAEDVVANVDAASVQQMGDQVLGLARALAETDLRDASAPDRVFHTFPVLGVVHYPVTWNLALCALAAAALAAVALLAVRRRGARPSRMAAGLGLAFALWVGVALLMAVAAAIYEAWYPNPSPHPVDEYLLPSSGPFAIAGALAAAALFAAAYRRLASRLGSVELALGFLGLWLFCAVLFLARGDPPGAEPRAVELGVGSYFFIWTLLVAAAAWLWVLLRPGNDLALVAPAALATFLQAPVLLLGYLGSGVADLPVLSLGPALIAGLVAASLTVGPGRERTVSSP